MMKVKLPALIIAGALALCLAAISATYWIEELSGRPDWQVAIAVTASVIVSIMTPISAFFVRSHGIALIASVIIFFVADTYQNAQGWQTFKGLTISSEVADAKARVATAQKAVDDLPTPSATGAIRRIETWTTVNTALTTRLKEAEKALADLQKPEAPLEHVAIVMGLIQIALSIFFACMGKGQETEMVSAEEETAEIETEAQPTDDENEIEETTTVIRFRQCHKEMDKRDLKAWNAITS